MRRESDHFSIRDALADIFRGYGAYVAPSITDPVYLRVILKDIKIAVGFHITSFPRPSNSSTLSPSSSRSSPLSPSSPKYSAFSPPSSQSSTLSPSPTQFSSHSQSPSTQFSPHSQSPPSSQSRETSLHSPPPRPHDIIRFLDNAEDTFYHHFVFLTNHELGEDLIDCAWENRVVLLDRTDLETELGKTHLRLLEQFHDDRFTSNDTPPTPSNSDDRFPSIENLQIESVSDVVDDHPLVRRLLADGQEEESDDETGDELERKKSDLELMLDRYREKNTPDPEFRRPPDDDSSGEYHEEDENEGFVPFPWVGEDHSDDDGNGEMVNTDDEESDEGQDSDDGISGSMWHEGQDNDNEDEDDDLEPIKDHPTDDPAPARPEKGLIITPKLEIEQLAKLSAPIAPITNIQMELVPYFVFAYTCTVVVKGGGSTTQRQGVLAVNGVTLEAEEWELGFGTINELAMDYVRLSPRVDLSVARDLAFNGVVQIETKVIRLTVVEEGIEEQVNRKTFPDPSSIQLAPAGVYYFPHWHIRGEGGSLFIDAVNGDVISSQYQKSE